MPHVHFHGGGGRRQARSIPKGCFAVIVGQGDEVRRYVIPEAYVNHPLFLRLMKEAEEEYVFEQKGPISIPCHVEEFCYYVRGLIDKETSSHRHRNHHHCPFFCFKA